MQDRGPKNDAAVQDSPDPERQEAKLGANRSGLRAWNERLVLTLVRRHGALPKSEIARRTGLSAQAISVIMRGLEAEGFLVKCEPVRGKVGQPSVPMRLDADGAFFLGLKVGRRRTEMALIDFLGQVRGWETHWHPHPDPAETVAFALATAAHLEATLPRKYRGRLAGLGIGLPFGLWNWADAIGVPEEVMEPWRDFDLVDELARGGSWPVFQENDASAACNAELTFGTSALPRDFLHAYFGFFVGGGLVLNGRLYTGSRGNAGALASVPVPDGSGGVRQLYRTASLATLEQRMGPGGHVIWERSEDWPVGEEILGPWIREAAQGLAHAMTAAVAICDLEALLIDGWMPVAVRDRLVAETAKALEAADLSGLHAPRVLPGTAGPMARVVGAAALPLAARFLTDSGLG